MDFTRQPIVETIITPREGYRLVVRSSKGIGQEEHFVEALDVVTFGNGTFYRSAERPKPFLVPASDYEVVEVREQRLVLKTPASDNNNQQQARPPREPRQESRQEPRRERPPREPQPPREPKEVSAAPLLSSPSEAEFEEDMQDPAAMKPLEGGQNRPQEARGQERGEGRGRGRDRHRRRGRGRDDRREGDGATAQNPQAASQPSLEATAEGGIARDMAAEAGLTEPSPQLFRTILPPPTTLIRDDLQRMRENELYRGAFYIREKEEAVAGMRDDDDAALASSDADMGFSSVKEVPPQEVSFLASEPSETNIHKDPTLPIG